MVEVKREDCQLKPAVFFCEGRTPGMDWENMELRVSGITDDSIVDGPGMRYSIFVQGCPHHCVGCHNPQTHSYRGGTMMKLKGIMREIRENPLLYGVTFSGGEPFDQPEALAALGRQIKQAGYHLMAYSGYTYEELRERTVTEPAVGQLLDLVDILVDGRFEIGLRDLTLLYRGSSNQRLIDLASMRAAGDLENVILCKEEEL
jgi:anaerobic ribonucleoside-triphosphate reductase activating protein